MLLNKEMSCWSPVSNKVERVIGYFDGLHVSETSLFKLNFDGLLIMDPTDKISNIIVIGSDSQENWLKLESAGMEQHLTETLLQLRVLWLLVDHGLHDGLVVAVYGNSSSFPQVSPQFCCHYRNKEFFQVNENVVVLEVGRKASAEVFFLPFVPRTTTLEGGIAENTAEDCAGYEQLNAIENGQKFRPPQEVFLHIFCQSDFLLYAIILDTKHLEKRTTLLTHKTFPRID